MTPNYAPLTVAGQDGLVNYVVPSSATRTSDVRSEAWPVVYLDALRAKTDETRAETSLAKYRRILSDLPAVTRVGDPAMLVMELDEQIIAEAEDLLR